MSSNCFCGGLMIDNNFFDSCRLCHSIHIKNKPVNSNKIYISSYQKRGWKIQDLFSKLNKWILFLKLRKYVLNKKVLDYGCGDGKLVKFLLSKSIDIAGYDPFFYKKRIVLQKKYDVIILSHVIEHVPNPERLVLKLKDLLLPNGKMIISTPRSDSLEFYIAKSNWFHFDMYYHHFLFSKQGLTKLMHSNSFKLIDELEYYDYPQTLGYSLVAGGFIKFLWGVIFSPFSLVLRMFRISPVMNLVFQLD